MAAERKKILLRLDPEVYDAVARWAGDELRSVNAQIEYALRAGAAVGRAATARARIRSRAAGRGRAEPSRGPEPSCGPGGPGPGPWVSDSSRRFRRLWRSCQT